jgi:glycine rich protein
MSVTTILIKRNGTSGSIPLAASITQGELALNFGVRDGSLYYLDASGTVALIRAGTSSLAFTSSLAVTASFATTASFALNAAGGFGGVASSSFENVAYYALSPTNSLISGSPFLTVNPATGELGLNRVVYLFPTASVSGGFLTVTAVGATASVLAWTQPSPTASYAITAAFALNGGGGSSSSSDVPFTSLVPFIQLWNSDAFIAFPTGTTEIDSRLRRRVSLVKVTKIRLHGNVQSSSLSGALDLLISTDGSTFNSMSFALGTAPGVNVTSWQALSTSSQRDTAILSPATSGSGIENVLLSWLAAEISSDPKLSYTLDAIGGDSVVTLNGFKIHTFTTVGTSSFGLRDATGDVEYLVVGGGAAAAGIGGSGVATGGGGGGGFRTGSMSLVSGSYVVIVGDGGVGTTTAIGANGQNSQFNTIISLGGGGGGADISNGRHGIAGGSGGGGGASSGVGAGGEGTIGQGSPGGAGANTGGVFIAGGGGGAGASGSNGDDAFVSGSGGSGSLNSFSGTPTYYAGGGAGGSLSTWSRPGAAGGGGTGNSGIAGGNATANTGGGGGGTGNGNLAGGSGGSGIVIIRYPSI